MDRTYERVGGSDYSPGVPDADAVLWFIRKYGISGLGGSDGCYCMRFELAGITVEVSCHKSEHCVRVTQSNSNHRSLFAVAAEVLSQLPDGGASYRVRFCDYSHDHVNGRWENGRWCESYSCAYCGKPREDKDGYLCGQCGADPKHFDVSEFEASRPKCSDE